MMRRSLPLALGLVLGLAGTAGAQSLGAGISQNLTAAAALPLDPSALPAASVRNGQEIFTSFRDGLAEPSCDAEATSPRWQKQFAHAPSRLANQDDDALVLFGYVVEELRKSDLPTEFALIPFVESGYRPNARNGGGPAGLSSLPLTAAALPPASVRNGQDIFASFRDGLAEPTCDAEATSPRWQKQFAHAPSRLANQDDDALVLFGYVVEELRKSDLPTEFALIPFVESGYRPNARNGGGPAGLWQFIATTAKNHRVQMTPGYDGRLSAVDSTQAAVRYLKTLHGMFGGDWRLATMAYNAGEYRVLQ